MAIVQWDVPMSLFSPVGELVFNEATTSPFTSNSNYLFLLDKFKCKATPTPLRYTSDPVPQADGSIIERTFKLGYTVTLGIELWIEEEAPGPACDDDLRVMWDTLIHHANALLNPSDADLFGSNARLVWTPPGTANRMFNRIRTSGWPDDTQERAFVTAIVQFQTEFAYAMDEQEVQTEIVSTPASIINGGSSEDYPVFRITADGAPLTDFTLTNITTDKQILYNSSLPGAVAIPDGQYAEIDCFRNTIYLNGSGANLKAGVDVADSDFFPLVTGPNELNFVGVAGSPTCLMLWQDAWS